jgi:hypothetical protein
MTTQFQLLTKCINWTGAINSGGYPITWHNNKTQYAHRVAVNALIGDVVRHTCDNPICVNPEHLIKGSSKENSEDMVRKQRQAWGERAARSKLTESHVKAIRKLEGCAPSRAVAKEFNISKTNVLDIWKKKIWKYL